jgi:hypothetical protein
MCFCDYPAISETANIKAARRPHTCSECGLKIEVGQPYQRYDSLFDGCWNHDRFCQHCQSAWETAWVVMDCACNIPVGEVWSGLYESGVAVPFWMYDRCRERISATAA